MKLYKFIGERLRPVEFAVGVKKLLRVKRRFFDFGEFKLFLDPISNFGIHIMENGSYEPVTTKTITTVLDPGDCFVDLGANEGYFSLVASRRVGESGKVFAIEPQERLWTVIYHNCLENDCFNVQLLPVGVGVQQEKVNITLAPSLNTGSSSVVASKRALFWKTQLISIYPLDFLFEKYKITSVKLMKVDIEGFELFALQSARNILKQGLIKNLLIEIHPAQLKALGKSQEDVLALLKEYNYSPSPEHPDLYVRG